MSQEITALADFLMNLKSWAEISIIKGVKDYDTQSDPLQNAVHDGELQRLHHRNRKLGNSLYWILGTIPEYRDAWKEISGGGRRGSPLTIQIATDFYSNFLTPEEAIFYGSRYGTNPPMQIDRMYPSDIIKSSWKDQYKISFSGHKKIMKKTMVRLLNTQKDTDFIGKPVATYLAANSQWQSSIRSGKLVERVITGWELLLNVNTYQEMEVLALDLYERHAQRNISMNSILEEMFYLLLVFDIVEPVIKLDRLYFKSHYYTSMDGETMKEIVLENYVGTLDDWEEEESLRELSYAEIVADFGDDPIFLHKDGGIRYQGSDIAFTYLGPKWREEGQDFIMSLADGSESKTPAQLFRKRYDDQLLSSENRWSISQNWIPIGIFGESKKLAERTLTYETGVSISPADVVSFSEGITPYRLHTHLQITPDPQGNPKKCMILDGSEERPDFLTKPHDEYYTHVDLPHGMEPWTMKGKPSKAAIKRMKKDRKEYEKYVKSQPDISGLEASWMGLCSIDLEIDIQLTSTIHLINYVLGIPEKWVN